MDTLAHAALNLAGLERSGEPKLARWIALGAVAPDVPNALFFAFHRLALGLSTAEIYGQRYAEPAWQAVLAPSHSVWLVGLVLVLAGWRRSRPGLAFGASFALHVLADLLTHHGDAHAHLWPLSDARFFSPVSYWDRAHFAEVFVPVELALVVGAAALTWRREGERWRRALTIVSVAWIALSYAMGWAFWGT